MACRRRGGGQIERVVCDCVKFNLKNSKKSLEKLTFGSDGMAARTFGEQNFFLHDHFGAPRGTRALVFMFKIRITGVLGVRSGASTHPPSRSDPNDKLALKVRRQHYNPFVSLSLLFVFVCANRLNNRHKCNYLFMRAAAALITLSLHLVCQSYLCTLFVCTSD